MSADASTTRAVGGSRACSHPTQNESTKSAAFLVSRTGVSSRSRPAAARASIRSAAAGVTRGLCVVAAKASTSTPPSPPPSPPSAAAAAAAAAAAPVALATLCSSANALLSMSISSTSRSAAGAGSSCGAMLDGMASESSRRIGGGRWPPSLLSSPPPSSSPSSRSATVPSRTTNVSACRRSSVDSPGTYWPRSESRSLSSVVDVAP